MIRRAAIVLASMALLGLSACQSPSLDLSSSLFDLDIGPANNQRPAAPARQAPAPVADSADEG